MIFYQTAKDNQLGNVKFIRIEIFIHDDISNEFRFLSKKLSQAMEMKHGICGTICDFVEKIDDKGLFRRWMIQLKTN